MAPSNPKRPKATGGKGAGKAGDDYGFEAKPSAPKSAPRKKLKDGMGPSGLFASGRAEPVTGNESPAFLFVDRGPGSGQLIPIREGALVIGRASVSDLRLQHGSISRRHAQLTRAGTRFYIRDLGSQNGTYVNRVRIETEVEIQPGDAIAVGNALLKLRSPKDRQSGLHSVPVRAHATHNVPPPPRRRRSLVKVAIVAGAVGFGLAAVLAFAIVIKDPKAPTYRQAEPVVAQPPPTAPTPRGPSEDAVVDEKIRRVMAEEAAAEAKTEGVEGSRPPRTPAPPPTRRAILTQYNAGDVDSALESARSARDAELIAKIAVFQTRMQKAQRAIDAGDGATALPLLKSALETDRRISKGKSKHSAAIKKKLSSICEVAAAEFIKAGDVNNASRWLSLALRYDKQNAKAKASLAKLRARAGGEAKTRRSLEGAWKDEDKSTSDAATKKRSKLDDAFEN